MVVERIYACSVCGEETDRDLLTVKKASFFEMGVGGRAIKSRVIDHLCPKCLVKDEDYQRPPFKSPSTPPVGRQVNG